MKNLLENTIQLQIIHYLKSRGHVVGKTKTMGVKRGRVFCFDPYTFRGFPDLTAFCPSLLFIEVKTIKGKQSDEQKAFQKLCDKAGVAYLMARDVDDVSSYLQTPKEPK